MKLAFAISSDAELKKLFERLVSDIIDAGGFLRLHRSFASSFVDYRDEINQTPGFWNFIEQAVREIGMHHLARVYDQNNRSLSLSTLLHTIGQHTQFFEDDAVLKRVSAAYAEEFKSGSHAIDFVQLQKDIDAVSSSDPLVKKVILWRNNFGAHLSTDPVLGQPISGLGVLTRDEALALVDRAFVIYNRYLVAFEATSYSTQIFGEDDHAFLFKLLRIGSKKYIDDIEAAWRGNA